MNTTIREEQVTIAGKVSLGATLSFRSFNGAEFHTFDLRKGDGR